MINEFQSYQKISVSNLHHILPDSWFVLPQRRLCFIVKVSLSKDTSGNFHKHVKSSGDPHFVNQGLERSAHTATRQQSLHPSERERLTCCGVEGEERWPPGGDACLLPRPSAMVSSGSSLSRWSGYRSRTWEDNDNMCVRRQLCYTLWRAYTWCIKSTNHGHEL